MRALRLGALLLVLAGATGCSGSEGERASGSEDPFAYDAGAPLDLRPRAEPTSWDADLTIHDVTYASAKDGRVPALVLVPKRAGPFAGLIVQHGMPGSGADMVWHAADLARLGAVTVLINAPFARRGGEPVRFDTRDRAEQIQLIGDLRRAVDLLVARDDVDEQRIGYLGISYGGAMGGLLAGVERRIAAFVLVVGDGGLVEHFGSRRDAGGFLPPLAPERRRRWLAAMRPIEPLRYVRRASAPLLFQSGRQDELVQPEDAKRYQEAAPEPKEVQWYDAGHELTPSASCAQARWLARHIGLRGRHAAC